MITAYDDPFLPYGRNHLEFSLRSKKRKIWSYIDRDLAKAEASFYSKKMTSDLQNYIPEECLRQVLLDERKKEKEHESKKEYPRGCLARLTIAGEPHLLRASGVAFDQLELRPLRPFLPQGPEMMKALTEERKYITEGKITVPGDLQQIVVCQRANDDDDAQSLLPGFDEIGPLAFVRSHMSVTVLRTYSHLVEEKKARSKQLHRTCKLEALETIQVPDGVSELAAPNQDVPIAAFLSPKGVLYRYDWGKGAVEQYGGQSLIHLAQSESPQFAKDQAQKSGRLAFGHNPWCLYAALPKIGLYQCDARVAGRIQRMVEDEEMACSVAHPRDPFALFTGSGSKLNLWDIRRIAQPVCTWEQPDQMEELSFFSTPEHCFKNSNVLRDFILSHRAESRQLYLHALKDPSRSSRPSALPWQGVNELQSLPDMAVADTFPVRIADPSRGVQLVGADLFPYSEGLLLLQLTINGDLYGQQLRMVESVHEDQSWIFDENKAGEARAFHRTEPDNKRVHSALPSNAYLPDEQDVDVQNYTKLPLDENFCRLSETEKLGKISADEEEADPEELTDVEQALIQKKKRLLDFLANTKRSIFEITQFCGDGNASEEVLEKLLTQWGCKKTILGSFKLPKFQGQATLSAYQNKEGKVSVDKRFIQTEVEKTDISKLHTVAFIYPVENENTDCLPLIIEASKHSDIQKESIEDFDISDEQKAIQRNKSTDMGFSFDLIKELKQEWSN